ncbi:MAG: transposase [Candidatus Paceibacterota bacterium]|jgi:putative transposase
MQRKIEFSVGEYYHIYARGVDKRFIFQDERDYQRFIKGLFVYNTSQNITFREIEKEFKDIFNFQKKDSIVSVGAYCLMPNHFHILLKETEEGGISKFLGKLLTSYSMYFNRKNTRTGSLFESRFKAVHANTDEYLKYLVSYIHLNPVKIIDPAWKERGVVDMQKAENFLDNYKYSSYKEYVEINFNLRPESKILKADEFPDYFSSPAPSFESIVSDWLEFRDLGDLRGEPK